MLSRAAFRLILLVSLAHALVHFYELSFPSVEQEIAAEFYPDDLAKGKEFSGRLSNAWRLLWGLGALAAGWLVDRYGGRRMLAVYLLGCGGCCLATMLAATPSQLTAIMLSMGAFASIYHPAGLGLIANETDPVNRPRALGLHGVLGSVGIGISPLVAYILIGFGFTWRSFYAVLAIPGLLLGVWFAWLAWKHLRLEHAPIAKSPQLDQAKKTTDSSSGNLTAFFVLTVLAFLQGFVYAAQMTFLPRYLSTTLVSDASKDLPDPNPIEEPERSSQDKEGRVSTAAMPRWANTGKLFASLALLLGCVGQFLSGRFARHDRLEFQLTAITLGNTPCLLAMAFATGWGRPAAAGLFALVHFMHQPIYNSLIPKYAPPSHRSLCFGFSIAVGLGCGSLGAVFAGAFLDDRIVYSSLAGVSLMAAGVGLILVWLQLPRTHTNGQ